LTSNRKFRLRNSFQQVITPTPALPQPPSLTTRLSR